MKYQKHVALINALDWKTIEPTKIIHVSLFFAKEFAQTVRACIPLYGHNVQFQQFIAGEIDTDNLQYEDYHEKADHWKFLAHFIQKKQLGDVVTTTHHTKYMAFFDCALVQTKLLTLISREKELQDIFQKIRVAHDWDALGYGDFKYFIERHLELDGAEEEGHKDLMAQLIDVLTITEEQDFALTLFWELRYEVYLSLIDKDK